LTKEELAELENNLLRLSVSSVEAVYETAYRDCASTPTDLRGLRYSTIGLRLESAKKDA
jgi:hypothetical protein